MIIKDMYKKRKHRRPFLGLRNGKKYAKVSRKIYFLYFLISENIKKKKNHLVESRLEEIVWSVK